MGLIVAETGQPLRVSKTEYNSNSRSRFNFVYSTRDAIFSRKQNATNQKRGELYTHSTVEAAQFCGVSRIDWPHPQEAKDLVKKLGFNPAEYAAAYAVESMKYYQLYNGLGEMKQTNTLLDIFETGDQSQTVLGMANTQYGLRSIIGGESGKEATDVFNQFFNNNKSDALIEVKVWGFTFKVHDCTKTFEEGVVHGMEQKVQSLKGNSRIKQAEKMSSGRFVVYQKTPVNKPYWQRDGERIVAHALSVSVVTQFIKKGKQVVGPALKDLKQKPPGTAWRCTNRSSESFEVYVYNKDLHGDWTCYVSNKKAAEGFGYEKEGSKKKRKRNN